MSPFLSQDWLGGGWKEVGFAQQSCISRLFPEVLESCCSFPWAPKEPGCTILCDVIDLRKRAAMKRWVILSFCWGPCPLDRSDPVIFPKTLFSGDQSVGSCACLWGPVTSIISQSLLWILGTHHSVMNLLQSLFHSEPEKKVPVLCIEFQQIK